MQGEQNSSLNDRIKQCYEFSDQVVLVSGGGGGIGRELVNAFALTGANVVAADIDLEAAQAACDSVSGNTLAIQADISNEHEIQNVITEANKEFGSITILVNCAAVALKGSVITFSIEDWDKTININLRGTFLMCRAVLPDMVENKFGRIINFSSIDARKGRLWGAAYSASKFGIFKMDHF